MSPVGDGVGGDAGWIADGPRPFLDRHVAAGGADSPGAGSAAPAGRGAAGGAAGAGPAGSDPAAVRPYLLTGGRTEIRRDLNVETIVTATGRPPARALEDDHLLLLRLLREPVAVAELAARSGIPIGVAMILAGDLADAGMVTLHDASGGGAASPAEDTALLRKVVNGVLKLRDAQAL